MICCWNDLLSLFPGWLREELAQHCDKDPQEIRLHLGQAPIIKLSNGFRHLQGRIGESDLRFIVNTASRYSPWASTTVSRGYITVQGGHRIGLCGETVVEKGCVKGIGSVTSLNIRIARDIPGIADNIALDGSILILGPPGCGKTTLLRDLVRRCSRKEPVSVVDERDELFPKGFSRGFMTDVLSGCGKAQGMEILLRSMGPRYIAVDEITSIEDSAAMLECIGCGVRLLATAHGESIKEMKKRKIYAQLLGSGIFDTFVVMARDKTWHCERWTSV